MTTAATKTKRAKICFQGDQKRKIRFHISDDARLAAAEFQRERERETETETDRQTDRDRQTEIEAETDRQTET